MDSKLLSVVVSMGLIWFLTVAGSRRRCESHIELITYQKVSRMNQSHVVEGRRALPSCNAVALQGISAFKRGTRKIPSDRSSLPSIIASLSHACKRKTNTQPHIVSKRMTVNLFQPRSAMPSQASQPQLTTPLPAADRPLRALVLGIV